MTQSTVQKHSVRIRHKNTAREHGTKHSAKTERRALSLCAEAFLQTIVRAQERRKAFSNTCRKLPARVLIYNIPYCLTSADLCKRGSKSFAVSLSVIIGSSVDHQTIGNKLRSGFPAGFFLNEASNVSSSPSFTSGIVNLYCPEDVFAIV